MSNDLTILNGTQVPDIARQYAAHNDELGGGISSGFAVFSIRGKTWKVKYKGDEQMLLRPDRTPEAFVEAVIVRAPDHLSKVFYEKGFVEGSTEAPDCYSTNGLTPALDAPKRQHDSCMLCPWNKFGSRISADGNGGKGKRCADSKRLAVLPASDLDGELWGGPMLLRVPAASLQAIDKLNRFFKQAQVSYFAAVVRMGFDHSKAHPELTMEPVRWLSNDEFAKVVKWREDDRTQRILDEVIDAEYIDTTPITQPGNGMAGAPPAAAVQAPMSQQVAAAAQRRAPAPSAPVHTPPVRPAPVEATVMAAGAPAPVQATTVTPPAPPPAPAPVAAQVEDASFTEIGENPDETGAEGAGVPAGFDDLMSSLIGGAAPAAS